MATPRMNLKKTLTAAQISGEDNIHLKRMRERFPDTGIYAVGGQIVKIIDFLECPVGEKIYVHANLDNGACVPINKIQIL